MTDRIADLARSFYVALRADGRSANTLRIYGRSIEHLTQFLTEQGHEPTLDQLTRNHIRHYLVELADLGRSPATIATRFRSLKRFCRWLLAEDEIDTDPMAGMTVPPIPETSVPIITDDELARLLKTCASKDWRDRRDEAIIRILLDCGLRVSELCAMRVDDLDLDSESTIVVGKGNKSRAAYFSPRTTRALDRWLRIRRTLAHADSPMLWIGQRGPIGTDGVRVMLAGRGRRAGIPGLHPHQLRHTFAHDFLLAGGGERDLKRLAGWSSDQMLERYGRSAADMRAREAARRLRRGDRV